MPFEEKDIGEVGICRLLMPLLLCIYTASEPRASVNEKLDSIAPGEHTEIKTSNTRTDSEE
jgi:hypothetical protein